MITTIKGEGVYVLFRGFVACPFILNAPGFHMIDGGPRNTDAVVVPVLVVSFGVALPAIDQPVWMSNSGVDFSRYSSRCSEFILMAFTGLNPHSQGRRVNVDHVIRTGQDNSAFSFRRY